jgi:hypothetical protein
MPVLLDDEASFNHEHRALGDLIDPIGLAADHALIHRRMASITSRSALISVASFTMSRTGCPVKTWVWTSTRVCSARPASYDLGPCMRCRSARGTTRCRSPSARLKRVSADIRTGLCSRPEIPPGKGLASGTSSALTP